MSAELAPVLMAAVFLVVAALVATRVRLLVVAAFVPAGVRLLVVAITTTGVVAPLLVETAATVTVTFVPMTTIVLAAMAIVFAVPAMNSGVNHILLVGKCIGSGSGSICLLGEGEVNESGHESQG